MKILIDLTSLADNFSGIERFASNIAYQLLKNNKDNKYILVFKNFINKKFIEFNQNNNIRIVVLNGNNKLFFSQIVLPCNLYRYKADAYLFMAFPAPLLFFKRNSITTIHDIGCWDCPNTMKITSKYYFRILYRKVAIFNKYIMTVSNFSKGRIVSKLNVKEEKIWIINNGLSEVFLNYCNNGSKELSSKKKYKLPNKYILCLSTLEPRKNMRLLIKAYEELLNEGKINMHLVLAGRRGWKINDLLDGLEQKVINKIHFTGFIDDDDLPIIYKNADFFAFPSLYEGFGIPPLEAMSMGTIVVSSDSTSLPEVLGENAIYFKNDNLEDLKDKICVVSYLLTDSEKKHIKLMGIKQSKLFSWENEASKLFTNLKKL